MCFSIMLNYVMFGLLVSQLIKAQSVIDAMNFIPALLWKKHRETLRNKFEQNLLCVFKII